MLIVNLLLGAIAVAKFRVLNATADKIIGNA
jgi:hypothetical protein